MKEALSEHLWTISTSTPPDSKKTWRDVLKAMKLLCKLHDLFDPPEQTNVQMNYLRLVRFLVGGRSDVMASVY